MATHRPRERIATNKISQLKERWASELCAEHDGSIADFSTLTRRLPDLEDYESILVRKKWNLYRAAKIGGGIVAGAAVFGPAAYLAAPGIASMLGATGLLGAASTGTAISTLHGAALTSASLAAIGPGGMASGAIFISAAGGALGAREGGVISNNYFGAIEDFSIKKVREGQGPALVFVNGFLSQKKQDATDWLRATSQCFPDNPCYLVSWEASALSDLGSTLGIAGMNAAFRKTIAELIRRRSRTVAQKANPMNWASTVAELFGNPWHRSMTKAAMTGILLADLLSRTDHEDGFILMGHSLGARVIYYLLEAMSTREYSSIREVYLLGGAVGRDDESGWDSAIGGLDGNIYNIYSDNDHVLRFLYQAASALLSNPIGIGPIALAHPKIINYDATSIVEGHMEHKAHFGFVLEHFGRAPHSIAKTGA